MKLIIAGGRDYLFKEEDIIFLRTIKHKISEVVSGGAKGADREGERWAEYHNIPIKKFPADWKQYGRKAGPMRNQQMAEYAQAVCLFEGGRGTASMFNIATNEGLEIYDRRSLE
jgi:hypothetical protein